MKIQYVGRQTPHRERLYGTGAVFAGPGDTQEIEDEGIAHKMLAKHPDQYGVADGTTTSQPPQAASDPKPAGEGVIVLDGEQVALEGLSKDVLIELADKHYGEKIPVRTGKPEVLEQVAKLITERGQPS